MVSPHKSSKLVAYKSGKELRGSIPPPSSKSIIMDFIKNNVTIDEIAGCWNWNKSVTSAGYGQFKRNKKYWTTHRFVYTQIYGEIPDGMVIRHMCHNPRCCNPEHLLIGTYRDNYFDSRELYLKAAKEMSKIYIVNDIEYLTVRKASKETGISECALCKYTNKDTRVFDIKSYREGCKKSRVIPRV